MTSSSSGKRNFISMQNKYDRVVLLVDMDCFYCQVEEKLNPSLAGQPLAVVQYNAWRGGGIIAVNYAARAKGVTRHMRGDEAKEQCPDIQLVRVPNIREKADLSKYRDAGKEVAKVLQRYTTLLERASVDEAYLDISQTVNKRLEEMNAGTFVLKPNELNNTYVVGYDSIGDYINEISGRFVESNDSYLSAYDAKDLEALKKSDIRLLLGSSIASEIRLAVKEATGYECSAGIAHNKILAKLACGINKPNKQTILPLSRIPTLFETLPVGKIKGLGAKFGEEICQRLNIRFLGQLANFSESDLQKKFDEKNGSWLYNIARGIDLEAVTPRFYSKSIGCCKKFPGQNNITGLNTLTHWLNELACEISERLQEDMVENNRRAKQMVVSYIQDFNGEEISSSRSASLACYEKETLVRSSLELIKANTKQFLRAGSTSVLNNPIKFVGISVGKFETINNERSNLQDMFANQIAKKRGANEESAQKTTAQKYEDKSNILLSDKQVVNSTENEKFLPDEKLNYKSEVNRKMDTSPSKRRKPDESLKSSFFLRALKKQTCTKSVDKENPMEIGKPLLTISKKYCYGTKIDQAGPAKDTCDQTGDCNDDLRTLEADLQQGSNELIDCYCENTSNLTNERENDVVPNGFASNREEQNVTKRKYAEVTDSHSNDDDGSTSNYQSKYVEYAVPDLRPEMLQYTTCSTCNSRILADDSVMQMHKDYHLAQQISKEQRLEYRQEIKAKITANKKSKNSFSSSRVDKTKHDITKFLKPQTNINHSLHITQPAENIECQMCSVCEASIPCAQMGEHMDYHMAKNLQRELNMVEVRTVVKTNNTANKKHNKSTTLLNLSNRTPSASKSITQFFTHQNS